MEAHEHDKSLRIGQQWKWISCSTYKWYLDTINPTRGLHKWCQDQAHKWYPTRFQVILNLKWSNQERFPHLQELKLIKWYDPCYDIGGGAPLIGIKVKDPTHGISSVLHMVSFQQLVVSIKNASVNHLLPIATLCAQEAYLLWELMTKGEK